MVCDGVCLEAWFDADNSRVSIDQSPWLSTHVIRGLTDKFNHHRVKVYHLHVFRDSRSAAAPHTEAHACRESEKGTIQKPHFR